MTTQLDLTSIAAQTGEAIVTGRVTRQEGERALGFVGLALALGPAAAGSRATRERTLGILRRIGVDVAQLRRLVPEPRGPYPAL